MKVGRLLVFTTPGLIRSIQFYYMYWARQKWGHPLFMKLASLGALHPGPGLLTVSQACALYNHKTKRKKRNMVFFRQCLNNSTRARAVCMASIGGRHIHQHSTYTHAGALAFVPPEYEVHCDLTPADAKVGNVSGPMGSDRVKLVM